MSQAIIVPLDGSEQSERALPWAAELARLTEKTLTLVQVLPWETTSPGARRGLLEISDKLRAELRDAALAYLDRLRQQLVARGVETYAEVAYGQDVASAILDAADELGAGAIVLASHGHGGLTRFMIGSVAQRVAQQSLIPTLIVRTSIKHQEHVSFEKLLVPLDGSRFAESSLELVNDIGGRASEIILARIVEPVRVGTGTSAELGSVIDWRATQEASYHAESYLSEQANALARAGLKVQGLVCTGNPDAELRRIADGRSVDLIIMSTHGRTGFNRFLFGSTTDAIIRHASQPVLLINARALSARSLEPYSVNDVYRRDVTSLRPDESLQVAMVKLVRQRETGVPVVDGDRNLLGFVSEYDFLSWHADYVERIGLDEGLLDPVRYSRELDHLPVSSIMSSPAIAVESEAPLAAAVELILEHSLHCLPVTSNGRLVGVVDRFDVLQALSARDAQLAATAQGQ